MWYVQHAQLTCSMNGPGILTASSPLASSSCSPCCSAFCNSPIPTFCKHDTNLMAPFALHLQLCMNMHSEANSVMILNNLHRQSLHNCAGAGQPQPGCDNVMETGRPLQHAKDSRKTADLQWPYILSLTVSGQIGLGKQW